MISFAIILAFSFLAAGLLSGALTWIVREVSVAKNWATPPRTKRHIHKVPIPRFGGIAIFGTFFGVGLAALGAVHVLSVDPDLQIRQMLGIAVPAMLLFVVGLADDIRPLSALLKLAFQVLAAAYLYFSGIRALDLAIHAYGHDVGTAISFAATIFWVVGISNAVNIIDGIDGLAAGSALFSTVTIFVMALTGGNHLVALSSIVLAGALLGFLRFNFNPATIFLGDCGSLLIGFLLSSLALAGRHTSAPVVVAVSVPIVALGLPVTETAVSIARRLLRGTGIFSPDRRHLHHRLLDLGLSQRQAVALLYGFSATCALASIFMIYPDPLTTGFTLIIVGVVAVFGIQKLGYPEFGEFGRIARRTFEQRRVISNNVEIRCAAEEIRRAESIDEIYSALQRTVEAANLSGFDLVINEIQGLAIAGKKSAPLLMEWSGLNTPEPGWTLSVQLVSPTFGAIGMLSMYGPIGEGQMLFDANVLLADLQPALSDSIGRLLKPSDLAEVISSSERLARRSGSLSRFN